MMRARGVALLSLIVIAACNGSSNSSNPTGPTTSTNPTTLTPVVGVEFATIELRTGAGAPAVVGNSVAVDYVGWFYDANGVDNKGAVFDSSLFAGRVPLEFAIGSGQVIAGFDRGVIGMQEGGARRVVIPPELAYGSQGTSQIPPNATLVFEIELLDIR